MYGSIQILDEIQKKRQKMIESANRKGMTNIDTIQASQELDKLIYEYQCQTNKTNIPKGEIKIGVKQMMMILPQFQLLG